MKPGWKTSEFWVTLLITVAGLCLSAGLPDDHPLVRVASLVIAMGAAAGYSVSRGMAKRNVAKLLMVAVLLGAVVGCSTKGYVRADAIDGLIEKVAGRHDRFVKGEPSAEDKDPANREAWLRSSMLLRTVVKEAQK